MNNKPKGPKNTIFKGPKKKKKVYVECPHCKGTGKVPKIKKTRMKCKDCSDHNHGCFGSGRSDEFGYDWCVDEEEVYE